MSSCFRLNTYQGNQIQENCSSFGKYTMWKYTYLLLWGTDIWRSLEGNQSSIWFPFFFCFLTVFYFHQTFVLRVVSIYRYQDATMWVMISFFNQNRTFSRIMFTFVVILVAGVTNFRGSCCGHVFWLVWKCKRMCIYF